MEPQNIIFIECGDGVDKEELFESLREFLENEGLEVETRDSGFVVTAAE